MTPEREKRLAELNRWRMENAYEHNDEVSDLLGMVDGLRAEVERYRETLKSVDTHVAGGCCCFGVLPCLATIGEEARDALAHPVAMVDSTPGTVNHGEDER